MSTRFPKVAILGIGPSGLAAAHAVSLWDGSVFLADRDGRPSDLYGCQYLHKRLPGITPDEPETAVRYELVGSEAGYRRKVYGDGYSGPVSVEEYAGDHPAWNLRSAYQRLWKRYVAGVDDRAAPMPLVINPDRLAGIADSLRESFDMVLSTVPAWNLCARRSEHTFHSQTVYAAGDAPDRGIAVPLAVKDDTVVCNGDRDVSWYRASKVFGQATIEWSGQGRKPPYEGVASVEKPLWTDCDCFPWIHRLGRYGSWRKSVLVHDVFEQAVLLMKIWHGHSLETKRKDWCYRCGQIAASERPVIEPKGKVDYRCLNGHNWSNREAFTPDINATEADGSGTATEAGRRAGPDMHGDAGIL